MIYIYIYIYISVYINGKYKVAVVRQSLEKRRHPYVSIYVCFYVSVLLHNHFHIWIKIYICLCICVHDLSSVI